MSSQQPANPCEQESYQEEALTQFNNNSQVIRNGLIDILRYLNLRKRHYEVESRISQLKQAYRNNPEEFDRLVASYQESENVDNSSVYSENPSELPSTGSKQNRRIRRKEHLKSTVARFEDESRKLFSELKTHVPSTAFKISHHWGKTLSRRIMNISRVLPNYPSQVLMNRSEDGQSEIGADTLRSNLDVLTESEGQGKSTEGSTPSFKK